MDAANKVDARCRDIFSTEDVSKGMREEAREIKSAKERKKREIERVKNGVSDRVERRGVIQGMRGAIIKMLVRKYREKALPLEMRDIRLEKERGRVRRRERERE